MKLHTLQKGNSSLKDYFSPVKKCIDALAAAGKPMSIEDHIVYLLFGLGSEFESMISVITAKSGPQTVQEVMALLLTQENRNESKKSLLNSDGTLPSAHLTHAVALGKENDAPKNSTPSLSHNGTNNRFRGRGNRGGKQWNNRGRIQCQLCGKFGHTTLKCYSRFYPRFQGHPSSGSSSYSPKYQTSNGYPQMSALLAAPELNHDNNWYSDPGATNHLMHNFNNLNVGTEYLGSNQVQVGNGAGLDISHFGHYSFQTPTNHIMHLNNLLHVPKITKNLITVNQFVKDNSVFFEFHPLFCCVKDQHTDST